MKHKLLTLFFIFTFSLGIAACGGTSDGAGGVGGVTALPQPNVNCGGSSCVN